jgi:NADH:ubiquinone oxidoreductase subunit E
MTKTIQMLAGSCCQGACHSSPCVHPSHNTHCSPVIGQQGSAM